MVYTCVFPHLNLSARVLTLFLGFFSASFISLYLVFSMSSWLLGTFHRGQTTYPASCWVHVITLRMASQTLCENYSCYEIHTYVRGYHVYKDNQIPMIGQVLLLKRESKNEHDRNAVSATTSSGEIVGHVPYNLAPIMSQFLRRDINKGTTEISGKRVN